MFFSVATLVDFSRNAEAKESWNRVKVISQIEGFALSPMPHISFHVAMDYDLPVVNASLIEITGRFQTFVMRASGVGVFSGIQPVVYFPVVKTRKLLDLHEEIWNGLKDATKSANMFYAPDDWMPHVTMAYQKADAYNICDVIGRLIKEHIEFEFLVDHLAIIYRDREELGQKGTFPFLGQDSRDHL
jgi:2'-5' RNA ligase